MLAPHFIQLLTSSRPAAIAKIQGDTISPVRGLATFYNTSAGGVLVQVEVFHLPDQNTPGNPASLACTFTTVICHRFYPTANMPGPPFMTRPLASLISWGDNEKGAFYSPFYVTNTLIINFDH